MNITSLNDVKMAEQAGDIRCHNDAIASKDDEYRRRVGILKLRVNCSIKKETFIFSSNL